MNKALLLKSLLIYLLLIILMVKPSRTNEHKHNKNFDNLLHIEVFLEGLYDESSQRLNQAHDFGNGHPIPAVHIGKSDTINIALHETGDYSVYDWGDLLVYETSVIVDLNGNASITIPYEYNGIVLEGSYWISINHRNHLETIYNTPINFSGGGSFYCDFITGDLNDNNALGNNQEYLGEIIRNDKQVHAYALFVGDINNDGRINTLDRSYLYYNLSRGIRGYVPEDLNGDGVITISDRSLLEKNLIQLIESITPANKQFKTHYN